jgi:hypothetical protein
MAPVLYRLITAPASEPVTQLEAETHLRLSPGDDSTKVNDTIVAARTWVESYCDRKLVTQVWELVLPGFVGVDTLELGSRGRRLGGFSVGTGFGFTDPATRRGELPYIELPLGKVMSPIVSVKYIDTAGVEQTLASSVYRLDDMSEPGRLMLDFDQAWPDTRSPRWDAVKIRYTVGWGFTANVWDGPASLKLGLLMAIAHFYDNRGAIVLGANMGKLPLALEAVLGQHRILRSP